MPAFAGMTLLFGVAHFQTDALPADEATECNIKALRTAAT